jgi:glycosyltransferase involved in cell wall biosynthesis
MKFGISGCMIVKNEELQIKKAIKSLQEACDEVIIVDTGSTDNTIAIAKEMGCDVYHYEWNHHYGRARNFSFSKAKYNWILYIDGDEILSDIAIYFISERFKIESLNDETKVYSFPIKDVNFPHAAGNKGVIRLFPKQHFYFEENISGSKSTSGQKVITALQIIRTDYPIMHDQINNCHAINPEKLLRRIADDIEANSGRDYDRMKIFCDGIINSVKEFYKRFIKKRGYKDGKRGLSWILMRSYHYFTRGFLLAIRCNKEEE